MRRILSVAIGATSAIALCGRPAIADDVVQPHARWYVAAMVNAKSDGELGGPGARANPLTNELSYLPLAVETGYQVLPFLRVHVSVGGGLLTGDETSGVVSEVLAGPDVMYETGRMQLGVRLDGGYSYLSYDHKEQSASLDAFLVEPKAMVQFATAARWCIGVQVGPRWKWIAGEGDSNPQRGVTAGALVVRRF
jgi:hypothetical protein